MSEPTKPITPEEAVRLWDEEIEPIDCIPCRHSRADDLLGYILKSLGYGELVNRFEDITKWYS